VARGSGSPHLVADRGGAGAPGAAAAALGAEQRRTTSGAAAPGWHSNGAGRVEKSGAPSQPSIGESASTACFSPTLGGEEVRLWQPQKKF
jgi:hypothetical protein